MATQPNTDLRTEALSMLPAQGSQFMNQSLAPSGTGFLDDAQLHLKDMTDEINNQIQSIQKANLEVNTAGLISTINESFNTVSNRITDAALASVRKSAIQMDAYFRSPTGDQRSGARVKMAMDMQRGLMQGAYEAIATVYDKHTQDIINVSLQAAQINASVAGVKIQGITNLIGAKNQAYMAVLSEVNKNYVAQLDSSLRWAALQADIQHNNDVLDLEYTKVSENVRQFDEQLQQSKQQVEAQLNQDRYKFDKEFGLEKQKYDDAKAELARSATADMLKQLSGHGSGQMSQTDALKAAKAIPTSWTISNGKIYSGKDTRSDDVVLKSLGWPDIERVQYSLQLREDAYNRAKTIAFNQSRNMGIGASFM